MTQDRKLNYFSQAITLILGVLALALAFSNQPTYIFLIVLIITLISINIHIARTTFRFFRALAQTNILLYRSLTYAILPLVWILLILVLMNITMTNQVRIISVIVKSDLSHWDNIYNRDNSKNITFKESSTYLWNKWRWLPEPFGNYNYDQTQRDTTLRIVHEYLKDYLDSADFSISDCSTYYKMILNEDYSTFRFEVISNYLRKGNLFKCISSIRPQISYISHDAREIKALSSFSSDFLRDHRPIFEIIVQNNTEKDHVLLSVNIDMKDLKVDTTPKAHGGNTLDISGFYDIALDNLIDADYLEWLKNKSAAHQFGFIKIYPKLVSSSAQELMEPRILIPANGSARFILRFVSGYYWPCKLRFRFAYNANRSLKSGWYDFIPITNPTYNYFE